MKLKTKKNILRSITCVLMAILVLSTVTFAHSGRTDAAGGHRDNNNVSGLGSYHYHHGYGPHLHPGGVCPYSATNRVTINNSATVKNTYTATTTNTATRSNFNTVSATINSGKVSVNGKLLTDETLLYKDKAYVPLQALIALVPNAIGIYDASTKTSKITVSQPSTTSELEKDKASFMDSNIVFLNADYSSEIYHRYECYYVQGNLSDNIVAFDRFLLTSPTANYTPCVICSP